MSLMTFKVRVKYIVSEQSKVKVAKFTSAEPAAEARVSQCIASISSGRVPRPCACSTASAYIAPACPDSAAREYKSSACEQS